jgi:pimeloyl-ACP methyl ester carboxylesterase
MNLAAIPHFGHSHQPQLWHEAFAAFELLSLRRSDVYAGTSVTQGDGSPVVVVPGLFASDHRLSELHDWLRRIGFRPYYSNIGRNIEVPEVTLPRLLETVERAYDETGRRVSIVGHSLGGLLARGAAMRLPDKVAQVVTLGSPIQGLAVHPLVVAVAELVSGRSSKDCLTDLQKPLPSLVAEVNVYSKDDGVVDWRTCTRQGTPSVGVSGTHRGLVVSREVYRSLAALLVEGAVVERRREANARRAEALRRTREHRAHARSIGSAITKRFAAHRRHSAPAAAA